MRSEWKEVCLGDVAVIKGGKRLPKGKNLISNKTQHPYIRVRDLNNNRTLALTDEFEYVDNDTFQTISRYIVDTNDVIISIVGSIGLVSIIDNTLDKASLTENCAKIVELDNITAQYLYYYLVSNKGQAEIKKGTVGAVQAKLPLKNIQNISISIPSLPEQKAIAATLSCLDDKIELNNKINANLEAQVQAIADSWFASAGFGQWPIGKLSDIALINPKRTLKKGAVATYVEMSRLPTQGPFPNGWEEKPYSGGAKFQNGDTLIARITPCLENGKTAYVNFLAEDEIAFGSTEYVVLTAAEEYPKELIYFIGRNEAFRNYVVKNMSGTSGRQRVSPDVIANFTIPIPPQEFILQYADFFATIMKVIRKRSFENRTLAAIRDTLLPKLMSGDIEIPMEVE